MIVENKVKIQKGAKIIIDTLKNLGVDTVFGYPGGVVLDLYDELYNCSDIKHVLVRHEQSAVHSAEGYSRVSGKCGIVLVTSGPGATNTVSGIVNAYLDGYPLIVLTGQVSKGLIGKDAFQEADICNITKSCTKKTYQITSAKDIQATLIDAMNTAMSGKRGPVVVDLVKDIFSQEVEVKEFSSVSNIVNHSMQNLDELISRINASSRPVIVSGGGVKHAQAEAELFEFAKNNSIPVVDTMMGLGTYPQSDENYLGMIGIFGDKSANQLLKDSDLILSFGARFNDRITCMFKDINLSEKFVQIDINPNEISKNISASISVIGDARAVLASLIDKCSRDFSKWLVEVQELKSLNIENKKTSNMLHSFEVLKCIDECTKDKDVIFTSEVGQHQLWTAKNLTFNKDRQVLMSGGSGTMGFGFPAAIGASIAKPEKNVVCIAGDGSFQMGIHELATCVDYNLNIKIMILNNGYLGMVRQLQEKLCDGRYSQTKITNPDFLTLAKSYGVNAIRVTSAYDAERALKEAFSTNGPFIIDFVVEPMELL